jgi:hypothetical protein
MYFSMSSNKIANCFESLRSFRFGITWCCLILALYCFLECYTLKSSFLTCSRLNSETKHFVPQMDSPRVEEFFSSINYTAPHHLTSNRICPLEGAANEMNSDFLLDGIKFVYHVARELDIPVFGFGGSTLSVLRVGSPSVLWNKTDVYVDNDFDMVAIFKSQAHSKLFYGRLHSDASKFSSRLRCPPNLPHLFGPGVAACSVIFPTDSHSPNKNNHKRRNANGGWGEIQNIGVWNAYELNSTHIEFHGVSPYTYVFPKKYLFPAKKAKVMSTFIYVPRYWLWFFSTYYPFAVPKSQAKPEYGRGCSQMAYHAESTLATFFGQKGDFFDDISYLHLRKLEIGYHDCAKALHEAGYASFYSCFNPEILIELG